MRLASDKDTSETFVELSSLICFVICFLTVSVNGFLCKVLPVSLSDSPVCSLKSFRNRVGFVLKTVLLDVDFAIFFFEYPNCLYCLPHCISVLEIITPESMHNLNKPQSSSCQKLSAHRASKLLTTLLSMVFTS